MPIDEKIERAQRMLSEQREELAEIANEAAREMDFDASSESLRRWKQRAIRRISDHVSKAEADRLSNERKTSFIAGDWLLNFREEVKMYDSFLKILADEISKHPGDVFEDIAYSEDHNKGDLNKTISVFISHSHEDVELVKRLIILLRSALNLHSNQIRATSVDGFRLPGGANTIEQLRLEVQSAKVLVGVISSSSLRSAYVTFELGARWGSGKPMIPLLVPNVSIESLAGPLQGINALSCHTSGQLHQFVDEMAGHLSLTLDRPAAYQKCMDEIVELCDKLKLESTNSIPISPSASQPTSSLSEDAKQLLMEASRDGNGVVMRFQTASGLHVKTNERDFITERSARLEARWQGALSELVRGGLLEDRNGKGEVFRITNLGYDATDSLTKEAPNTSPQADG